MKFRARQGVHMQTYMQIRAVSTKYTTEKYGFKYLHMLHQPWQTQKKGYVYIQPEPLQSCKPLNVYKNPAVSFEDSTVYKLSV